MTNDRYNHNFMIDENNELPNFKYQYEYYQKITSYIDNRY